MRVPFGRLCLLVLLCLVMLSSVGCTALSRTDKGSLAMIPFFDDAQGIQGVVPLGCSRQEGSSFWCGDLAPEGGFVVVVAGPVPGSMEEALAEIEKTTALVEIPEPDGSYRGKALVWDWWSLVTILDEPKILAHVDLALVEAESEVHLVALVTQPEDRRQNPDRYAAIFERLMYAYEPME